MASNHTFRGTAACRRGFTIVECLIGLAISAVLLAAVAAAFNASLSSYRENERMYGAINGARQALMRMTSEIRTAGYFDETDVAWYGVKHTQDPNNELNLYLPTTHEFIQYKFVQADKKLYLIKPAINTSYVLCNNVLNTTFTTTTQNGLDATSVQISLTVSEGGFVQTLSAAAVVRRIPPL